MTIYLYSGTPGTGKSLHAASEIRYQLSRKYPHPVIGNFQLDEHAPVRHRDYFHYYDNQELTPDILTAFADDYWHSVNTDFREDHINLILDECQLLFNSRLWTSKDRIAWLEFFSQHRKWGYKVIFIAQSAKMVDNQFRMLIEYEVAHRKISNMGLVGKFLGLPFRNRLFVYITYYFQLNERLGVEWYYARRKDMRMYDTHARFERTTGGAATRSAGALP